MWATEVLGAKLMVHTGENTVVQKPTEEVLAGKKFVLLYFSASWCGPCRKFSPLLAVLYEEQLAKENDVEVVYVSNDSDIDSFNEYYVEGHPWAAIPFEDSDVRDALGSKFEVMGIPRVVVLSAEDGHVVAEDARALITTKKALTGLW